MSLKTTYDTVKSYSEKKISDTDDLAKKKQISMLELLK